jgi:poly(3-hydroxyoctanoate) depolymerase
LTPGELEEAQRLRERRPTMGSGVDWNPEFVRAAGLRLRVGRHGAGRPLLLITGIGANLDMWAPFARLVGDRELIAFDPPGAGLSQRPRRPVRMRGLAGVVRELLDALGLERVDVLGYSFGGAIAQEMARATGSDRIHRLVLAATTCGWGALPGDPIALLALLTPARYYFGPATAAVTSLFGEGSLRDFATADSARLQRPPDPVGYWWQVLAAAGWSSLPWLRHVRVPTLVLAPERDRMVRASTSRLLARRIPDARLEVVPGAGHFFLLREDAREIARMITEFLNEDERVRQVDAEFAAT